LIALLNYDQYEEKKLLSLLAEGSEYAFQLLFDRHRGRIYNTAIRFLKSPILAQDVVQEVFLKLWLNRTTLDKQPNPIESWLYTVAKNNILNKAKKISNEWKALNDLPTISDNSKLSTDDAMQDIEYNTILAHAIEALPSQQKKIFRLSRNQQLTYIQIGEQLGLSPLTVKKHMSIALGQIKAAFAKRGIIISLLVLSKILE